MNEWSYTSDLLYAFVVWTGKILTYVVYFILYDFFKFPSLNFFLLALRCEAGYDLLILEVSRSHTTTNRSRQDSSGRVISPSQRPLPDSTQQTDIHAPGGIRTNNLSRQAAVDLHLKPPRHRDRNSLHLGLIIRKDSARYYALILYILGSKP
jgi:hypothetical protein